jgi:uncharacterized DUF497 family protein
MTDPIAPYDWDEAKRAANIADRRIDFTAVYDFEWRSALIFIDDREDYRELREVAHGFIGERLHILVFTRRGDRIRVIGLRKANKMERDRYAKEIHG